MHEVHTLVTNTRNRAQSYPIRLRRPDGPIAVDLADPRVQPVLALHDRVERDRQGAFVIEGLRYLLFAVEKDLPIERLLFAPESLSHPVARKLVSDLIDRGVPATAATPELLRTIANREDPQGVIAVTRQLTQPLAMSTPSAGLCWIAVDYIQSPGNLGTLLRTAECAGAAGLIIVGDDVDPYDPGCVRATMGAIFHQRIVRTTFDELREWSRRHRAEIVGTSPNARRDYHRHRYDKPTIVYLGSERKGMTAERQAGCDVMVRIPVTGRGDSLNVSIAGSVVIYEIFNQRRCRPPRR